MENMLYMSSQSANDGSYNLTVTFKLGTNLDMDQVRTQNRVNLAMPTLPDVVKATGVSVKKKSPASCWWSTCSRMTIRLPGYPSTASSSSAITPPFRTRIGWLGWKG